MSYSPKESKSNVTEVKTRAGITLVPSPTNDPQDPLNWPQRRKYLTLAIVCLAAFAGTASSLANQLAFEVQAKTYSKTPLELSYSISAAVAGVAFGPVFFVPLAQWIGRCATMWWSLVGAIVCNIWAASMTGRDQYIAFVLSRLFAGMFGSVPSVLGSGTIIDIFFLHERGKAFVIFTLSFLLGTVAGPTFGGFIVEHVEWPVEFWWTVGLQGSVLILAFFFLEETGFTRDQQRIYPLKPQSFVTNRMFTFFCGTRLVPPISGSELVRFAYAPFLIGFSPVTLLVGTFQFISFGWFVMINTLLTIFLQEPVKRGGYGFTPQQNAAFTFCLWFAIIAAEIYGHYLNDRIPLWLTRRHGGIWKPEYRLYTLWLPALILLPVGLGIFGAALEYHLHYMVLAVGAFLITFAAILSVPVAVNYVAECFKEYAAETGTIMNIYRLLFGLVVPFFITPWEHAVSIGWVFGMAAFFSIGSFGLLVVLMWKGHSIRQLSFKSVASTEEGARVTQTESLDM